MIGKYVDLVDSYKSLNEALYHAGVLNSRVVEITYLDSEKITSANIKSLRFMNAILVPGGFGNRGIEGKILAAKFARENNIPYLGICLGMQLLFEKSEESPNSKGLGIINGDVKKITSSFGFDMKKIIPEHRLYNKDLAGGPILDVALYQSLIHI